MARGCAFPQAEQSGRTKKGQLENTIGEFCANSVLPSANTGSKFLQNLRTSLNASKPFRWDVGCRDKNSTWY